MDAIQLTYVDSGSRDPLRTLRSRSRKLRGSFNVNLKNGLALSVSIAAYLSIVASVAIYDVFLTIRYWRSLKQMEENPMGRWLMNLDQIQDGVMPNLTLFITAKSFGTLLVLAAIVILVLRYSRIGHPVALGVSGFQLGLATYLTYAN